jgi:hypothetical protein
VNGASRAGFTSGCERRVAGLGEAGRCDNGHAPVADERQHEGRARDVHDRHGL